MVFKEINLRGFGKILVQPILLKEQELESVDPSGKSLTSERIGTPSKTIYRNTEGVEIPRSQICKKATVDEEEIIIGKFEQTKEVDKEDIESLEEAGIIYTALQRKFYAVTTDNERLKDLVINNNKNLSFPFVAGGGFKIWNAVLTNWHGHLLMIGCRGDLSKELSKYDEETVSIELEVIPNKPSMKKLVKAMVI